jgi:hypothetical protein
MAIKHKGTVTLHTIEVDHMTANLVAGFMWEALDKLTPRNPDDSVTMRSLDAATDAMKAFFNAAGVDYGKYTGTNLFKPMGGAK